MTENDAVAEHDGRACKDQPRVLKRANRAMIEKWLGAPSAFFEDFVVVDQGRAPR